MFRRNRPVVPVETELFMPEGYKFTYTVSKIHNYNVTLRWSVTYQNQPVETDVMLYTTSNETNLEDKLYYFGYRKCRALDNKRKIEESANLVVGQEIVLPASKVISITRTELNDWYNSNTYYDAY